MDNLSNSDRDVDARNGFGLHHGWIHSHLARIGGSSCGDTVAQWASSGLKHRSQSKGAVNFSGALRDGNRSASEYGLALCSDLMEKETK